MPLLRWLLAACQPRAVNPQIQIWLGFSLLICLIFGLQSLTAAFDGAYVVQDDARQHVFWMQRYRDPTLFPDDLIADYFQSVAPSGYKAVYLLGTSIGIDPLLISKLLPLFLGLVTTYYYFGISWQIFPVPASAFLSSVLLNQALWMEDDLVSATPRAFLYPFFAAFLYYVLQAAILPCLGTLAALALFYPPMALLGLAVLTLRLVRWSKGVRFSQFSRHWQLWGGGLVVITLILGAYQLTATEFGPLIAIAQARQLPIFNQVDGYYGRAFYFHDNPLIFWLFGPRTGLLFWGVLSPLVLAALALPMYLTRQPRISWAQTVTAKVHLLSQIALGMLGLYSLAHGLSFQLHFPSRYVYHGARFVLPMAASIALFIYGGTQLSHLRSLTGRSQRWRHRLWLAIQLGLATVLMLLPFSPKFSIANQLYVTGKEPELYQFLLQQPHQTLVASIDGEANNLPTFAHRRIVAGREYALPYHWGYFSQFQQQALALIKAHYSSELSLVQDLNTQLGIDFWLLHKQAFEPDYVDGNRLLKEFQQTRDSLLALESGSTPALASVVKVCTRFTTERHVLLDAACINDQS